MIPKILHYVWVGDKEKPATVKEYIESWKKYCPNYQIIEWNNEKFQQIDNKFATQAYENKKWAFVSDYLRLYALYNYGGIYLDTDVEITQNIDKFLIHDFFTGFEKYENNISCVTALMGAKKHSPIIKDLLDYYKDKDFITSEGLDMTPNTKIISEYFQKNFGLQNSNSGEIKVILQENSVIYPYYYFCKKEEKHSENYAIHHFDGSWIDSYSRKNLIKFGNYKIVKFKYIKNKDPKTLQLLEGEKVLLKKHINRNKIFALIKS